VGHVGSDDARVVTGLRPVEPERTSVSCLRSH